MSKSKRQQMQQQHFGQCRGRQPSCPCQVFYIADILHNLLRVVPQIFLHTMQAKCDKEQLKDVGQWTQENVSNHQ
jgi:hypothetical protein